MKKCKGMSNIDIVKHYLAGTRPFTQISFRQAEKDKYRKEGETWTIDGIKYKKVKGKTVKITKTQSDIIRESINDALSCKICQMKWSFSNKTDRQFLLRTGLCLDCLSNHETKLRALGIYEIYEKYRLASYELGFLKESRLKMTEALEYFNRTGGDVKLLAESEYDPEVVWKNTNKEKMVEDINKDLEKANELIAKGEEITKNFKTEYLEKISKYNLPDIINNNYGR